MVFAVAVAVVDNAGDIAVVARWLAFDVVRDVVAGTGNLCFLWPCYRVRIVDTYT